jgi:hypothetical protein
MVNRDMAFPRNARPQRAGAHVQLLQTTWGLRQALAGAAHLFHRLENWGKFNGNEGSGADRDVTDFSVPVPADDTLGIVRGWMGYSPVHPFGSLATIGLLSQGSRRPIALRPRLSSGFALSRMKGVAASG